MTSDDIMTSLLKKLSISIKILIVKSLCSLFVQFRNCRPNPSAVVVTRELVHTADVDPTRLCVVGVYLALL